ncbi:MAG: aminopeptidase P family protein [Chloroflexi bacterium]|nr:aminopeptidase P family protein [Chloroflexota bacterium]
MREAPHLDFPLSEYRARLHKYRMALESSRLDAVLLGTRDSVEHLTGFSTVSWRLREKRFWTILSPDRGPVLIVDSVHLENARATSWVDDVRIWRRGDAGGVKQVAGILRELGLDRRKTLGLEVGKSADLRVTPREYAELAGLLTDANFVDATDALAGARMGKSEFEVERIARACEITCAGMQAGFESIRPGMTERDLLRVIASEWLRLGADSAYNSTNPGYLSVQSGRALQMGPSPSSRPAQPGDLIQVDGGAVYRGYCSDIYRNAFVGEPPARLRRYSEACAEVLARTLDAVRPGVTSREIAEASDAAARTAGVYDNRRPFSDAVSDRSSIRIGHGFGWSLVEPPLIDLDDQTAWMPGMCGGLQISIGDPETGYIEWEDNFVVTDAGRRVLTADLPPTLWVAR